MKSYVVTFVIGFAIVTAGSITYFERHKAPPAPVPAPVVDSPQPQPQPELEPTVAPKQEPPRAPAASAAETPSPAAAVPVANIAPPAASAKTSELSDTIDALLSPQTALAQRKALFKQLKSSGQLDQAIEELKQRATDDPNDPAIPTTLGVAYLSKFPVQDPQDGAVLGLEADQSFNAALKLDPANWDAQFLKAQAMTCWPAEMNKGDEIVQRFSSLIEQQDTMPSQPLFAQTYVLLGDEYQKLGQPDYAEQTWKLGAAKFPADPTLQKRLGPH
jgi:tetratricopeptide (TPR) repeat protein